MKPDANKAQREQENEQRKLERLEQALSDKEKQQILDQAEALKQRQLQEDDGDILPSVGIEDIPTEINHPEPDAKTSAANLTSYSTGTNGIIYQQIIADLPAMSLAEIQALPLLAYTWTETGVNGADYLQQQQKQASLCGSLSSYGTVKPLANNEDKQQDTLLGYYTMSGKALASNTESFSELLADTWRNADFSDEQRLSDLVGQLAMRRLQGITGNGHGLAMQAAAARISDKAALSNQLSGLPLTKQLKKLHQGINDSGAGALAQSLQALHGKVVQQPTELLIVQDSINAERHQQALSGLAAEYSPTAFQLSESLEQNDIGFWLVDSQVNFCSLAFSTVNQLHPDAPALAVAAGILRNGFLHTAIREQGGAYGAGASQDSSLGVFKFYSYRDPRIEGTMDDFRTSIDWLIDEAKDESLVEQSILGIIGSMDRPGSPAGEAKINHHALKAGRSYARRQQYRAGLLAVTLQDVKRVAETYLKAGDGKMAVVAPKAAKETAVQLGLNSEEL
jgi:Zn-dependent M16 (insulinase) family peptidase